MAATPLTFDEIDHRDGPLAILVHGFPDTPYTFRHLAPRLVECGYRVVAPWLPGYTSPVDGSISVGTYAKHILATHAAFGGDERCLLIGHDWGAMASYGAVALAPDAFARMVTLAVPPIAALSDVFVYRQLKRSFYIWLIQQVGIADIAVLKDGFWEGLWGDWSPGYDATFDIAQLRSYVTAETIGGVLAPYRAQFDPAFADPDASDEANATLLYPSVPTLYLHGADDGALGAEMLSNVAAHLPAPGSGYEVVPNAGHFLHLEQPDLIWERIENWWSKSTPTVSPGRSPEVRAQ
ncbi:alpha/beta fold hydrolase [Mycolicibacterium moriokaense]|uniref:Pimeloyl-ACP methyl ester carboxylesterase n=1 Tax=Mycolicibacterium moriokaense TaxID=39691 RepID=A0A318H8E0_9MYCO|nr:alpha/beta hydrolase [Mycolicibacterium moriokaense]PXX01633.1 pimeloyl-ACP methyl ester carboxylesterase [Mycolicibacterium moriokaense]